MIGSARGLKDYPWPDGEPGCFTLVASLEVLEHVYAPTAIAETVHDVLVPGGIAVLSALYYAWLKNVAIALLDRFDDHVNPLRMHGHIKFWSRRTLTQLLEGAGFAVEGFQYAGRIPPLAKSMLAVARRPETGGSPRLQEGG